MMADSGKKPHMSQTDVPVVRQSDWSRRLNLSATEAIHLEALAAEDDRPIAYLIRQAVQEYLERRIPKP